ncbi:Patellin-3 [Striga hermonthica]|uniref:Patellin-3 n=1 Tax=Striga hermonthica TaxID=68872 RepID=A0A9N7MN33_STRHE|nr:Patellin-3 [Striga hermonthica]
MAAETKETTTPESPCAAEEVVVVVPDVPVAEKSMAAVVDKEAPPQPEPEKEAAPAEKAKDEAPEGAKTAENNNVEDLIDPEKKALDEFKVLIQEALSKHEFSAAPPLPPPAAEKEEEKKEAEQKPEEKQDEEPEKKEEGPKAEEKKEEEPKTEEKVEVCEESLPAPAAEEAVEKKVEEKVEAAEEIKETIIVHEVTAPAPPPCEEQEPAAAAPPAPEEVSIWGVRLLADKKSDAILLKFLRARDFKVKEAFAMLKSVVAWRKEFKIEELLDEENIVEGLEKVVYMHGVDKEGHPICYNAFGEFQNKELYDSTFADAEKRAKFLKWYIQFLEKNVRKLDFGPDGICTIVQIIDFKNSPGLMLFKKELRQATNQALQLLQDNYPEFVAKQVFINVPWWYLAYNRMISPFLTQRTKSKFVFPGSTRTTESLFKYIAPEQVPVQYGGLSKEGDQVFTTADPAKEEIIKPNYKHTIEFPVTEAGTLLWEVRVIGWEVSYGAEFVPSAEGGYTWIIQKARKIGPSDEQVISCSFKNGEVGKVALTLDNKTSKKKHLIYRSKTNKPSE